MRRIPLRVRDGSIRAYALVDDADYEDVARFRWCLRAKRYVARNCSVTEGGGSEYLHRRLLGLVVGDGLQADHRIGDSLDNRRENLRVATNAQNAQNRRGGYGESRHRGVARWPDGGWQAGIKLDGKRIYLGIYATEEEAARVAASARARYMPFSREAAA